jgi:DNA-3-methyladenine glycosylase I
MLKEKRTRCQWVNDDPTYVKYHDKEWGVPIFNDRILFEFLILEGMQAGLNWLTILKKRENFRKAFNNFDAKKIAKYNSQKINSLLTNPGIIRNRLKIQSVITNAQALSQLKPEWKSFSDYIWHFVDGKPIKNHWKNFSQIPNRTEVSDQMSKDLKKRGFKFIGSTICYAFMQAVGMVNDHTIDCYRYKEVNKLYSN